MRVCIFTYIFRKQIIIIQNLFFSIWSVYYSRELWKFFRVSNIKQKFVFIPNIFQKRYIPVSICIQSKRENETSHWMRLYPSLFGLNHIRSEAAELEDTNCRFNAGKC